MAAQTYLNPQRNNDLYNYTVNYYNSQIPKSNAAKGASAYATMVDGAGDQLDKSICQVIGKVVCVQAPIMKGTAPTWIRFSTDENDPNAWNMQVLEVERTNPNSATYAVTIPTVMMNRELFFKVGLAGSNTWSRIWAIDLKNYGHLTTIRLHPVTFD